MSFAVGWGNDPSFAHICCQIGQNPLNSRRHPRHLKVSVAIFIRSQISLKVPLQSAGAGMSMSDIEPGACPGQLLRKHFWPCAHRTRLCHHLLDVRLSKSPKIQHIRRARVMATFRRRSSFKKPMFFPPERTQLITSPRRTHWLH